MKHQDTPRTVCVALLMLLISLGAVGAQAEQRDIRATLEAANGQWMAAFNRGDSTALAALYTVNGQLFPTHSDIVRGTAAIAQFWQSVLDAGIQKAQLVTMEAEGYGDTAYEVGAYTLMGAGEAILDMGKYVVVWKREQGQWKLHRDIWNTSRPASGQ